MVGFTWAKSALGISAFLLLFPAQAALAVNLNDVGTFFGVGNATELDQKAADLLQQTMNSTAVRYTQDAAKLVKGGGPFETEALVGLSEYINGSGLDSRMADLLRVDPGASPGEQAAAMGRAVADGSFARGALTMLDGVLLTLPGINSGLEARILEERALELAGAQALRAQREKVKSYAAIGRYAAYAVGLQSLDGFALTCATGSVDQIEAALAAGESGVAIKGAAEGSMTPLHLAARYNRNPGAVRVLVRAGADVNARDQAGETPLHKVMLNLNNTGVIAVLAESGANFSVTDNLGRTPLDAVIREAFLYDKRGMAALIKAQAAERASGRGSETRTADNAKQENPFTRALFRHLEEPLFADVDTIASLIAAGADVNARNSDGDTLLFATLRTFAPEDVVEKLLDEGADPCLKNSSGETVLHSLAENAALNGAWLRYLLPPHKADRPYPGLDVNAVGIRGESALGLAVKKGFWGDCMVLVDAGADVNQDVPPGQTPLCLLLREAKTPDDRSRRLLAGLVDRFVAAGADMDKKGGDGRRAADVITPEVRGLLAQ